MEKSIITDSKPLVGILKMDLASLSQKLQFILLRMQTWPRPLHSRFTVKTETKMRKHQACISPVCMSIGEIQEATQSNAYLQQLKEYIIHGWPLGRNKLLQDICLYWTFRDSIVIMNRTAVKGKRIIIPAELQQQVLEQLHNNHIGIEKTRLDNLYIGST